VTNNCPLSIAVARTWFVSLQDVARVPDCKPAILWQHVHSNYTIWWLKSVQRIAKICVLLILFFRRVLLRGEGRVKNTPNHNSASRWVNENIWQEFGSSRLLLIGHSIKHIQHCIYRMSITWGWILQYIFICFINPSMPTLFIKFHTVLRCPFLFDISLHLIWNTVSSDCSRCSNSHTVSLAIEFIPVFNVHWNF